MEDINIREYFWRYKAPSTCVSLRHVLVEPVAKRAASGVRWAASKSQTCHLPPGRQLGGGHLTCLPSTFCIHKMGIITVIQSELIGLVFSK